MNGIKRIILSSLAVVLALVALGTTTYAWFTVTSAIKIDPIDLKLESVDDLDIAVLSKAEEYGSGLSNDGDYVEKTSDFYYTEQALFNNSLLIWKKTISLEDIKEAYFNHSAKTELPILKPVTSVDSINFKGVTAGGVPALASEPVSAGTYLQVPIYFRTTNKANGAYINLTTIKGVGSDGAETDNVKHSEGLYEADLTSAFRLGFVPYSKTSNARTFSTSAGSSRIFEKLNDNSEVEVTDDEGNKIVVSQSELKLANGTSSITSITEENAKYGSTSFKQTIANNVGLRYFHNKNQTVSEYSYWKTGGAGYGEDTQDAIWFAGHAPSATAPHTYDIANRVEDEAVKNSYPSVVTFGDSSKDGNYFIEKAHLNIWIEGWDRDTVDIIHSKTFRIAIRFTTTSPTDEDKVTIQFNINGATGTTPSAKVIDKGDSVTLPILGTGYTGPEGKPHFLGWATEDNATEPNVTSATTFDANATIYAVWSDTEPSEG